MVLGVPGTGRGLAVDPASARCPSSSFCGADPYGATEAHAVTAGTERGRRGRANGAGYSTPAAFSGGAGEMAKGSHRGPPTAYGKEGPAPEATPGADYFGCHSPRGGGAQGVGGETGAE